MTAATPKTKPQPLTRFRKMVAGVAPMRFATDWMLVLIGLGVTGRQTRMAEASAGAAAPWELSLSGSDWQIASFEPGQGVAQKAFADGYFDKEAIAAIVPGDVHWDLERIGKIPPIHYGQNSKQIGWVAGKEWWYRRSFSAPTEWKGKTIRLRFEGVDYLTDVWLNGQLLGRHEGQFTPFEFDVTGLLRVGGENVLAVLIHPAPAAVRKAIADGAGEWGVMHQVRAAYPYWKCMTTAGWDWGCKILTMGIGEADGDTRAELEVRNVGASPALFVKLSASESPDEQVCCEDSCFFLPPKETRCVRITQSAIAGQKKPAAPPVVQVGAWNSGTAAAYEVGSSNDVFKASFSPGGTSQQ